MSLKSEVAAIAPELTSLIYGTPQKTRILIQDLTDFTLVIDDAEYIYEVQPDDTVTDIVNGLVDLIEAEELPIVSVVNVQASYFDIRGVSNVPFVVSSPASEILEVAVPETLWDILLEDAEDIINEDTFKAEINRAQRYFMAHMLTMHKDGNADAGVSSQAVGSVSVSYATPTNEYSKTRYGAIYYRIYLDNRRIKFT